MIKHIVCCYSSEKAQMAEAEIKSQGIEYTTLKRYTPYPSSDEKFSFSEWYALPYILGCLIPSAAEFLPPLQHAGSAQFCFIMDKAPVITQGKYPHENEIMQYSVEVDEKNKSFTARAATRFRTRSAPGSNGIIRLEYKNVFYYTPTTRLVSFDETIKLENGSCILDYFRIPECRTLRAQHIEKSDIYEVSPEGYRYSRFKLTPQEQEFGFSCMNYSYDAKGIPIDIEFDKYRFQVEKRLQMMEEAKAQGIVFITPAEIAARCRGSYELMRSLIAELGIQSDLDDTVFPILVN